MAHEREERLAEAEKDYQHALSILSRAGARDDLTFVRISTALSSLYMDLYRLDEAHQLLRRAVAVLQKPQTRETVSFVLCLDIWAELLLREGKYTAAEEAWKSALSVQSPATEMSRLQVKSHLAEFHISMAEYKRAEVELREIANAWRDAGLKEDLLYARILTDLGVVRIAIARLLRCIRTSRASRANGRVAAGRFISRSCSKYSGRAISQQKAVG